MRIPDEAFLEKILTTPPPEQVLVGAIVNQGWIDGVHYIAIQLSDGSVRWYPMANVDIESI